MWNQTRVSWQKNDRKLDPVRTYDFESNGKPNVITQWSAALTILHDLYAHPKQEIPGLEKVRILEAAAECISNDVKSLVHQKEVYPENNELPFIDDTTAFLPMSLNIFQRSLHKQ